MNTNLKPRIQKLCLEYILGKITQIEKAIAEAQQAANQETKSSVGDKYETGRAMMQLEIEKLGGQLAEWTKTRQQLEAIDPEKSCTQGQAGALMHCSSGCYYISVAAGKLVLDGQTYFAISPQSPIGELLMGKKAGETLSFRGQNLKILEIF